MKPTGLVRDTNVYCRALKWTCTVKAGTSYEDFDNIAGLLGNPGTDWRVWGDHFTLVHPDYQPVVIEPVGYAKVIKP